ncbi:hypothetical protein AB0F17_51850 [Nonomuraea sp. NPDC026600]|uniref:hypothetical protein n=1 Tax=Nonomuraea sp. NPDC026600 TaxID=3155363 RepID=UPI0033F46314
MDRITREDLLVRQERGAVQLVEALPVDAFAAEHLPGARNVPGALSAELARQVAPDRAGTARSSSFSVMRRSISASTSSAKAFHASPSPFLWPAHRAITPFHAGPARWDGRCMSAQVNAYIQASIPRDYAEHGIRCRCV